jgi:1-pyrroline-5-carboxylate dehydrogenase
VELAKLERRQLTLRAHINGRKRSGGGKEIKVVQPHDHQHVLGVMKNSTTKDAQAAVKAALDAAPAWRAMPFDERCAVILKAADLLAGPWRQRINAATMLGQSKTAFQAEIDSACELIDFWRFNVHYARRSSRAADREQPGHLEPHRPPPARGLRLRDHAVQLHRDRRQPADRRRR